MDFHTQMQKEHELKYREYERLRAECPKSIKAGDKVLVAVGFIGHGFHWIREECDVLKVAGDSSYITFPSKISDITGKNTWEHWIPNCLIVAILDKGLSK